MRIRSNGKPWFEILGVLSPLIIGVVVTGGASYFGSRFNERQLEISKDNNDKQLALNSQNVQQQMQINQISMLERFRPYLLSSDASEREFAYASFSILGQEELALRIMKIKGDIAGKPVALDILQTGSTAARKAAATTLEAITPRVSIHFGQEWQKDWATSLASSLKSSGFKVPDIENVSGVANSPKITNVRYFNETDKDTADSIAAMLRKEGFEGAKSYRVAQFLNKPGDLEVWFSADKPKPENQDELPKPVPPPLSTPPNPPSYNFMPTPHG